MDLLDEARPRLEGHWVAVWPVHRVYEVEPALAALTAAGIPAPLSRRYESHHPSARLWGPVTERIHRRARER